MTRTRHRHTVDSLCEVMGRIAPIRAAAERDNVGLLVGDSAWPMKRILLTIDLTGPVLDEARRGKFDAILSYHPTIFRPVSRMVPDRTEQAGIAAEALASRIAVYSPHTAFDAAVGGANDCLAERCGLADTRPFAAAAIGRSECKLAVFVPVANVDQVAEAVFQAGAGRIGDYEKCSYRLRGEGTFFGTDATDPVVGRKGRLERVEEIRMEVVFPKASLADVAAAVRRSHPYEEPAFDVYPLETLPDGRIGQGRIGRFKKAITLGTLARRLTRETGAANVQIVGKASRKLGRALVCVGMAGSMPFELADPPCGRGDVVITGEMRHHDALRILRYDAMAILLGHWASERPALAPLAARLKNALPGVSVNVSRADYDPFKPG